VIDAHHQALGQHFSPESGPTLVLRRKPLGTVPPAAVVQEVFEARLLAILDSPITSIETPTQGFDRKERSLGNAFAELTTEQARALVRRFEISFATDLLARKFRAMSEERQERLYGFLLHCANARVWSTDERAS
jgi:hypothetical protein